MDPEAQVAIWQPVYWARVFIGYFYFELNSIVGDNYRFHMQLY